MRKPFAEILEALREDPSPCDECQYRNWCGAAKEACRPFYKYVVHGHHRMVDESLKVPEKKYYIMVFNKKDDDNAF